MTNALLSSPRITLRALEPSDIDVLCRWENDTTLWQIGSTVEPYARYTLERYIAYAGQDIYERHQLRLMIEQNADHMPIGSIDLYDFDPRHMRAGVGILIDDKYRQQGFAAEALQLMIDYAFRFLHLHQLYAQIPTDNAASLQLFAQAGFNQSGTLRSWQRTDNGYSDVALFQLVASSKS